MTTFWKINLTGLLALILTSGLGAQDFGFAQALMDEGDTFRAITVLKQIRYEARSPEALWGAQSRILESYWLAGKFENLQMEAEKVSGESGYPQSAGAWALVYQGLALYGLGQTAGAHKTWSGMAPQGGFFPRAYQGLALAKQGYETLTKTLWTQALKDPLSAPETLALQKALGILETRNQLDQRSPWLAGILSAVIPGAGQGYTGHWVDAVGAFFTVGLLGLATYGVYLYDSHFSDNYVYTGIGISLTSLFHLANIFGAAQTAGYFNRRQTDDYIKRLEEPILALPRNPWK